MSLTLDKANTLARGHFNPFIITPEWLSQRQMVDGEFEVTFGAITHGLHFRAKQSEWEVDFDHLLISSTTLDCGDLAAKVLQELPHTPVRAIGNNFQYACTAEEWGNEPVPMLGNRSPTGFPEIGEPEQVRWTGVFSSEGVRIELTVGTGIGGVAVLLNFHRFTEGNASVATIEAAQQFRSDKVRSRALIRSILNKEIPDD